MLGRRRAPGAGGGIFIGDVALDEYFRADYWPGLRDKVDVRSEHALVGGMIANAACRYAGYGAPTQLVTALNGGAIAERLEQHLAAAGVATPHLIRDPSLADSRTLIFLVGDEHTVFIPAVGDYLVPLEPPLLADLLSADFVYATVAELKRLRGPDGTSGPELLSPVRAAGTAVVLDLDVGGDALVDEAYLPVADLILANELGFARLRGADSEAAAAARLRSAGTELVVVTRGPQGCTVFGESGRIDIAGIPVDVVDVTGAGDAFGSSLLYGLFAGWGVESAARFANAAAARTVSIFGPQGGAGPAQPVIDFLAQHDPVGAAALQAHSAGCEPAGHE